MEAPLPKTARLHEATVKDAERHQAAYKRSRERKRPTVIPMTLTRVDRRVWTEALKQAGGDPGRIEVHSSCSVTVHNKAKREK